MKYLFVIFIILTSWIEAKSLALIHYDPFQRAKVLLKSKPIQKYSGKIYRVKALKVDAILNQRAYIDGNFYGVGSKINGYKILQITDNAIKVKKDRKIVKIPLIKSNYFDMIKK